MTETKTITAKTFTPNSAASKCDTIQARHQKWQAGPGKTADDQLYALLADAYEIYLWALAAKPSQRRSFNEELVARGVTMQANTPMQSRIVRFVFNNPKRYRAYNLARVLFYANKAEQRPSTLPDWIRAEGGIEEIRLKGGDSRRTTEKTDANYAADFLASAAPLIEIDDLVPCLRPGDGDHVTLSVALVRSINGGQSGDIIWGSNNGALINRMLAIAGKQLRTEHEAAAKVVAQTTAPQRERQAVKAMIAKAKTKRIVSAKHQRAAA